MRLVKIYFVIILISCLTWSCNRDDDYKFAPETLKVTNFDKIQEDIFSTKAVDINDNGIIIGWTESSNYPLYRFYERPSRGFIIHSDNSGCMNIGSDSLHGVWPLKINEHGMIAGAYLPVRLNASIMNLDTNLPAHAFLFDSKTGVFTSIHETKYYFTVATHINNNGLAAGYCGFSGSIIEPRLACLFNYPDSASYVLLHPEGAYESYIAAMNDGYCIVRGYSELNGDEFHIIRLSDLSDIGKVPLDGIPYLLADVTAINSRNEMVGWLFSSVTGNEEGFTYKIGESEVRSFRLNKKQGKWDYMQIRFTDINNQSQIAAIAGRLDNKLPFPQSRAAIINFDFSGFEDITPDNGDAYSDAYAINNLGEIVGYAGYVQRRSLQVNRAFVVK